LTLVELPAVSRRGFTLVELPAVSRRGFTLVELPAVSRRGFTLVELPAVSRRGFTLVELLVVVSIIALLLGILIPSVTRARQIATKTACAAHLHQVGVAIQGYRGTFGNQFPKARYMPEPFLSIDTDPDLPALLDQFVASEGKVFKCPGDNGFVYELSGSSYVYNTSLAGKQFDDVWFVQRFDLKESDVQVSYDFDGKTYATMDGSVTVPTFHLRRNLLFADGHVGNFE